MKTNQKTTDKLVKMISLHYVTKGNNKTIKYISKQGF